MVVQNEAIHGDAALMEDFVMNVGGSVWALDWCPRDHEKFDCPVKLEFLDVAAHPAESYYHKVGVMLTGRGLVQIWYVLNPIGNKEEVHAPLKRCKQGAECKEGDKLNEFKKPRGRPRKTPIENITKPKRPKGRPRKKPINESPGSLDNSLCVQALVVQYPEEPSGSIATEGGLMTTRTWDKSKQRKKKKDFQ